MSAEEGVVLTPKHLVVTAHKLTGAGTQLTPTVPKHTRTVAHLTRAANNQTGAAKYVTRTVKNLVDGEHNHTRTEQYLAGVCTHKTRTVPRTARTVDQRTRTAEQLAHAPGTCTVMSSDGQNPATGVISEVAEKARQTLRKDKLRPQE